MINIHCGAPTKGEAAKQSDGHGNRPRRFRQRLQCRKELGLINVENLLRRKHQEDGYQQATDQPE